MDSLTFERTLIFSDIADILGTIPRKIRSRPKMIRVPQEPWRHGEAQPTDVRPAEIHRLRLWPMILVSLVDSVHGGIQSICMFMQQLILHGPIHRGMNPILAQLLRCWIGKGENRLGLPLPRLMRPASFIIEPVDSVCQMTIDSSMQWHDIVEHHSCST